MEELTAKELRDKIAAGQISSVEATRGRLILPEPQKSRDDKCQAGIIVRALICRKFDMKWLTVSLILVAFCGCKREINHLEKPEHETVAWGESVSGLQCRVKAERDTYYIGEEVRVTLEIRNGKDVIIIIKNPPQREIRPREFTGLRSEAHITLSQPEPAKGGFFCTQSHPFPKPGESDESNITLKPGETYSESLSLGEPWGPVRSAYPARAHTGDAQIQATTSLDISSIGRVIFRSNVFHITILDAATRNRTDKPDWLFEHRERAR